MADRFHLTSVKTVEGAIWYTLVLNDPIGFYVEKYNDSRNAFIKERTKTISPDELPKHWVNGMPLISLVENKLEELAEISHLKSLGDRKSSPGTRPAV